MQINEVLANMLGGKEMERYKRHICFHYYRVVLEEKEGGDWTIIEDFNVADWLAKIDEQNMLKKEVELSDCMACIEKISLEDDEDIYSVRFHKLRDTNIPSKFKSGYDAKPIELDKDEYIAEEMNILYDRRNGICMVQQNRMSLGTARLAEWMSQETQEDQRVVFLPIKNTEPLERFRGKQIRSINLTFANMEKNDENLTMNSLLGGIRRFGGCTAQLSISVGRNRYKQLDNMASVDLIEQLREDRDAFTGAKVKMRDDDRARTEIVDILDESLHDFIEFEVAPKQGISFDEQRYAMLRQYKKRINDIANLLNTVEEV